MGYLYVSLTIFLIVFSQLLMKWRIASFPPLPAPLDQKLFYLLGSVFDPFIFGGFFAAFLGSLCWIAAMTILNISHAYPILVCALLVLVTIGGVVLFGERLSTMQIFGIVLILFGIGFFVFR